jgi:hypothetical protein
MWVGRTLTGSPLFAVPVLLPLPVNILMTYHIIAIRKIDCKKPPRWGWAAGAAPAGAAPPAAATAPPAASGIADLNTALVYGMESVRGAALRDHGA